MDLKTYLTEIDTRCRNNGMYPDDPFIVSQFTTEYKLKEKQKQYSVLLDIISNILEKALGFMKDVPILIAITDDTPMILHILGDSKFVKLASDVGIQSGAILEGSNVGANAPLAAVELQTPVSLLGTDHFFRILHNLACYSIPILNVHKKVVATVSLLTTIEYAHPCILGMLSISEIAIEREWELVLNKNH